MDRVDEKGRKLPLVGAHNVRDLGGFSTQGGGTTASGRLFRGDSLSCLTDADVNVLADATVTTVVDFRGNAEAAAAGADRLPPGATLVRVAVLDDTTQTLAATLVSAFDSGDAQELRTILGGDGAAAIADEGLVRQLGSRTAMDGYARTIREAAAARGALLFHCTGGKDRTGMMAAVALGLLGVPNEEIIADYLASNENNKMKNDALYARLEVHGIDPELVRPLTEQRPQQIRAVLKAVQDEHGGWKAFATGVLGLDVHTIEAFQERMLA
ncbi:MAG: tyrosine-protein phosphatase [Tomitella sp.]|nr:tyrosine-protein phosphatase [Tomitella sp.]